MLLETKYLGETEIDESKVIHFPAGLLGFSEVHQFVLLDLPGNSILQILQSITTPDLAFIVTDPYYFYKDYEFQLGDSIQEQLKIKQKADVFILSIVTVKDPFKSSTINLQAPLIINSEKKLGKQYILNDTNYSIRANISLPNTTEKEGE